MVGQPARPARGARRGAAGAASPALPLSQIVEQILVVSDNEAAEVLGHQVGLATGGRGSFADGAAGVEAVLGRLGVPFHGAGCTTAAGSPATTGSTRPP